MTQADTGQFDELLKQVLTAVNDYRSGLHERRVSPSMSLEEVRRTFDAPLPDHPTPPAEVIRDLLTRVEPGLMASVGPRFFGFVIGGALPGATAADMLAAGWDQCAFNPVLAPAAAVVEEQAGEWLKSLLRLPSGASVGFVTGAQEANTVGLAAARHHVLSEAGWDVERLGLHGGPRVRVVASEERHATIDRSVRLLGMGDRHIESVAADANGAIDVRDLRRVLAAAANGPVIVCLQAGNVNTGAVDDLRAAIGAAREFGAWVHVDGAFGLWAAASQSLRELVDGVELADSWGCDGHKWLNVPYDSAFAFCSLPAVHSTAVSYTASYLLGSGVRAAMSDFTLESSRRARGFAVWAALRELGRSGVAELVERCCALARRFASGLAAGGGDVVNDVVLNQVLVSFGDSNRTDRVIAGVQEDGTCWLGGTTWRGQRLMRVSVSNWSTTEEDVDRSVDAIRRVAASV